MDICQYEFQFENEYIFEIEETVCKILDVKMIEENRFRFSSGDLSFILYKKNDDEFMLFSSHPSSTMYLVIIRCQKKYEEIIRNMLFKISDEIEEDYGEDHRWEVKDVYNNSNTWLNDLKENDGVDIIKYPSL